jgi:hypothetical protein
MDHTKLPIALINKYIWDLASGQVKKRYKLETNESPNFPVISSDIWDTSQYSINGNTVEINTITVGTAPNANITTIVTATNHGLILGQLCEITDVNSAFNGMHKVKEITSPTQFKITTPVGGTTLASTPGKVKEIGLVPFFPVSENLAASTETTPFIIYDFLFTPPGNTQWFVNCEKAVYTIVGELPQIYYLRNFIYESLKKFDVSAQEINDHIDDPSIRFKFIKCEQSDYMLDEKRIDSFKPKFVTTLVLNYDYTKV